MQNNMHELWALLNFLFPKIFSSSTPFGKSIANYCCGLRSRQLVLLPLTPSGVLAVLRTSLRALC
jgi:hypothetical protein